MLPLAMLLAVRVDRCLEESSALLAEEGIFENHIPMTKRE